MSFWTRLFRWKEYPESSPGNESVSGRRKSRPPKTYEERYAETSSKSTPEIEEMIEGRQQEEKKCGVAFAVLADRSDQEARRTKIDPPRLGRKTYNQRYAETNRKSTSELIALRNQRRAVGKPTGVIERILSER